MEMTLKQLSTLTNISVGTLRSWTLKPINGQPYNSKQVNYEVVRAQLKKYFDDFEKRFGFSIDQLVIVKGERTTKEYVEPDALSIGDTIILHNYALQTEMTLVSIHKVNNITLWIFEVNDRDGQYKCYTMGQLTSSNIKLELRHKM